MQNPFVNIGTQFFISASLPATYDAAGYAVITWTQIRGSRSVGDIGERYLTREVNEIGNIRRNARSGKAINSVPLELIKITDAGQALLKAAFDSPNSYSYKVLAADGTIYYFTAECTTWVGNPGEVNSLADISSMLELSSYLTEV